MTKRTIISCSQSKISKYNKESQQVSRAKSKFKIETVFSFLLPKTFLMENINNWRTEKHSKYVNNWTQIMEWNFMSDIVFLKHFMDKVKGWWGNLWGKYWKMCFRTKIDLAEGAKSDFFNCFRKESFLLRPEIHLIHPEKSILKKCKKERYLLFEENSVHILKWDDMMAANLKTIHTWYTTNRWQTNTRHHWNATSSNKIPTSNRTCTIAHICSEHRTFILWTLSAHSPHAIQDVWKMHLFSVVGRADSNRLARFCQSVRKSLLSAFNCCFFVQRCSGFFRNFGLRSPV